MTPSSRNLIAGIARTLEQDVLPDLAMSTWTASYIRSCLALLAHLEVRVVEEGPFLFEDNAELRSLLLSLRADLAALPDAAAVAAAALAVGRAAGDYPSIDALTEENTRLKSALEYLVAAIHDGRDTLGEARFQDVHGRVLAYLRRSGDREFVMFEKASGYSPL
ncbi:MAG: hypothetical protein GC201_11005 [Alphaproteobacteria bacterium]|nr:hypothetical protein [Alphaproteobacteria bacterium]